MYLDKTRLYVQGQPVNGVSCETDRERTKEDESGKKKIEEYFVYPMAIVQGSMVEPRFDFLSFSLLHWHLGRRVG